MALMKSFELLLLICLSSTISSIATSKKNNYTTRGRFTLKKTFDRNEFSTFAPKFSKQNIPFKMTGSDLNSSIAVRTAKQKQLIRRSDEKFVSLMPRENSIKFDSFWIKTPFDNFTARRDSVKKLDHSFTLPTWSSKKEIYQNSRNRKHKKHYIDSLEDYLGMDSKYHDMGGDRKYIHEHEGFFFPIHVPQSHNEKDDNLIPLLLLLLLPLLLFAIIIPLNANLLSTLFLIMQNNGATSTAAQLAAATGRRRRRYVHQSSDPFLENRIMEALIKIGTLAGNF